MTVALVTMRGRIERGVGRPATCLAVALAATTLTTCGGGDKKDGRTKDSKTAFVNQANAICLDGARATAVDVQLALGAKRNFAQETEAVVRYSQALGGANGRLRALKPPAELSGEYAKFTSARDQAQVVREDLIAARRAGDQARIAAGYMKIVQLDQEAFGRAEQLGLSGCDYKLPPSEEQAVKTVVEEAASSSDGSKVRFTSSVGGFEGVSANVAYVKVGGSAGGGGGAVQDTLFFDKQSGRWRIWDGAKTG